MNTQTTHLNSKHILFSIPFMHLMRSLASNHLSRLVGRQGYRSRSMSFDQQRRFSVNPPRSRSAYNEADSNMKANTSSNSKPTSFPTSRFTIPMWLRWAFGSILALTIPLWNSKYSSLLRLEGQAEKVITTVEVAAEVVEEVALVTEKVSSELVEKLPEDGKLKNVVVLVEQVSEKAVEEAQMAIDIVHKVNELKEEVESFLDPTVGPAKATDEKKGTNMI
ncbi:hypothetical protein QJS04_geneDACA019662 [Acorus gramineus]|uniref:Uncharacterized protein n=1 Tax=Acorus gramineus TaxID=55184 RepID=A0AAV9BQC3_ACOGR|nr:hypothetical protein QJS04_geneDACA019662 [Acorus gramineus]